MDYYKLVTETGITVTGMISKKEYICTQTQKDALESRWTQMEERGGTDFFEWERQFFLTRICGSADWQASSYTDTFVDAWDKETVFHMDEIQAKFVYVPAANGTIERYAQITLTQLKKGIQLVFPNPQKAMTWGDKDLIAFRHIVDDESGKRVTNQVYNTVYHYDMCFPNENAAKADMHHPSPAHLRTFYEELFGDA